MAEVDFRAGQFVGPILLSAASVTLSAVDRFAPDSPVAALAVGVLLVAAATAETTFVVRRLRAKPANPARLRGAFVRAVVVSVLAALGWVVFLTTAPVTVMLVVCLVGTPAAVVLWLVPVLARRATAG